MHQTQCGEAFAAWLPPLGVPLSYGVAISYVLVDTYDKFARARRQVLLKQFLASRIASSNGAFCKGVCERVWPFRTVLRPFVSGRAAVQADCSILRSSVQFSLAKVHLLHRFGCMTGPRAIIGHASSSIASSSTIVSSE